jgi:hypothetical protein
MQVADKKSFQKRLDAVNGRMIMWMPDTRYSFGCILDEGLRIFDAMNVS